MKHSSAIPPLPARHHRCRRRGLKTFLREGIPSVGLNSDIPRGCQKVRSTSVCRRMTKIAQLETTVLCGFLRDHKQKKVADNSYLQPTRRQVLVPVTACASQVSHSVECHSRRHGACPVWVEGEVPSRSNRYLLRSRSRRRQGWGVKLQSLNLCRGGGISIPGPVTACHGVRWQQRGAAGGGTFHAFYTSPK